MNPPKEKKEHIAGLKAMAQYILDALSQGAVDQAAHLSLRALEDNLGNPLEIGHVLGRVTGALYDNFLIEAVEEFHKKILALVPRQTAAILDSHLEKRFSLTREWEKKIEDLCGEDGKGNPGGDTQESH